MKVEREYLVPYLNDICALYYAEDKINHDIEKHLADKVALEQKELPISQPQYEDLGDVLNTTSVVLVLLSFAIICAGCSFVTAIGFGFLAPILLISGLFLAIKVGFKVAAKNEEIEKRNEEKKRHIGYKRIP